MHTLKQVPPAAMTPAQRRQEIAALLADGLVRLRAANAEAHARGLPETRFDLGFLGPERVHTDPDNQPSES